MHEKLSLPLKKIGVMGGQSATKNAVGPLKGGRELQVRSGKGSAHSEI